MLAFISAFGSVGKMRADSAVFQEAAELRPLVRAVIATMLREGRDHPDVEDCTSETLRRALEGHGRLRDGEALRPWLIGIARHVALDTLRSKKRASRRRAADPGETDDGGRAQAVPLVERAPDPAPGPFERLARARRDERIKRAMSELPEGSRKALTMFHIEGLSYQEISARLGVPLGTVATWVARGRKAMAGVLSEDERDV
jgi:RNA polymerase sigma-70 factor (ECF subfamily)